MLSYALQLAWPVQEAAWLCSLTCLGCSRDALELAVAPSLWQLLLVAYDAAGMHAASSAFLFFVTPSPGAAAWHIVQSHVAVAYDSAQTSYLGRPP